MTISSEDVIRFREVTKSFGGVDALRNVTFPIAPGRVHGLLGANGSGKSTLIKVLAGFHVPDAGQLYVNGESVEFPISQAQLRSLGMGFVFQDLNLIPELTVLENFLLVEHARSSRSTSRLHWAEARADAERRFGQYGVRLDLDLPVRELNGLQRALLAIVRALTELSRDTRVNHDSTNEVKDKPKLLVLDEPTVFLPKAEIEKLFEVIRTIASSGSSVLLVTHDLDEVLEITDQVTVLRDGERVYHGDTSAVTRSELVEHIVGRPVTAAAEVTIPRPREELVLRADRIAGQVVQDVSFELKRGEVLGITGLAGAGFEEVPYLIFGGQRLAKGTISLADPGCEKPARPWRSRHWSASRAVKNGMVLVPEDRKTQGSIAALSVEENMMLPVLNSFFRKLRLENSKMRLRARQLCREFDVRPQEPSLEFGALSGGNQQKVVLAKWLQLQPSILLLIEPTQGVDIATRLAIFDVVHRVARDGCAVVCASSDFGQLAAICSRVLIIDQGRVAEELTGPVTKQTLAARVYGGEIRHVETH